MKEIYGVDGDWIKKSVSGNFSPACFHIPQSHKFDHSTYLLLSGCGEKCKGTDVPVKYVVL